MPRIRTIKPEFWDSPSTKEAGPWARLLYIAMWNWADDHGRGTANLKELEGFAFPNDDTFTDRSGNTVNFRSVVAEVSECFGVVLYEVSGRPYYAITAWDKHQRNERRSNASRHPEPPSQTGSSGNTVHLRSAVAETPRTSGPGTGEQGNRGTGEQSSSSSEIASDLDGHPDDDHPRPEVAELCNHLAARVATNGHTAKVGKLWHRECRLLLDRDGHTVEQVRAAIDWATADPFWSANIRSMRTLREKYSTLQAQARQRPTPGAAPSGPTRSVEEWEEAMRIINPQRSPA